MTLHLMASVEWAEGGYGAVFVHLALLTDAAVAVCCFARWCDVM